MRKWHVILILLVLTSSAALLPLAPAQELGADLLYSRHRHFKIPFNLGAGADRLKQLQLFYSTDRGRSWRQSSVAAPDKQAFHFMCERDGLYWFSVQTLDKEGNYYPQTIANAAPSLKVLVDTLPPVVQLRSVPPLDGKVGVTWEIREEYLDFADPSAIQLEYRIVGGKNWIPLSINRVSTKHYWNPGTNTPVEVRLRVKDRAENIAEMGAQVSLVGGQNANPFPGNGGAADKGYSGAVPQGYAGARNRQIINSKDIRLNCEVNDLGPSGVSELELWYTTDGRNWNRYPLAKTAVRDAEDNSFGQDFPGGNKKKLKRRIEFTVDQEGVYGFTIVAKSGVGRSRRPPQIGEAPQIWVEVDETNPTVTLRDITVSKGIEKNEGKLLISWSATDKNPDDSPITISYAENRAGPWQRVVTGIPNDGRYIWSMRNTQDSPMPYQFYVRVEARDQAGNIGEDTTREIVRVDLSEPRVNILKVEPVGR